MNSIALSLLVVLLSFSCRGPEVAELTPGQERFEAFREALTWDIDMSKSDLNDARAAMDASGKEDLQMNARWQSIRRQLETLEREVNAMDSVEQAKLEKMIRDLGRLREEASDLRTAATVSRR